MTRWFRFYDDALNDPKVQELPDRLFKRWVNLLCVASKSNGRLPDKSQLTYLLRGRCDWVEADIAALMKAGLIDDIDGTLEPHNWSKFQYKSDSSTERVRAHRSAARNVSETPPDNREQRTDTEKKKDIAAPKRGDGYSKEFEMDFWKPYPRTPVMSKSEAWRAWQKAPDEDRCRIIAAVPRYASWLQSKPDHPAVHACRFITQRRFDGFSALPDGMPAGLTPEQQRDWQGGWRPGMPSSAEIMKGEANGREGTENPMGRNPSMAQSSLRLGGAEQGLERGSTRQSGTRSLVEILRDSGVDALGVQRARQVSPALDRAGPMADLAAYRPSGKVA